MEWLQLHLLAAPDRADACADALNAAGALSVTYMDAEDEPIYEPGLDETPLWTATRVTGLFAAGTDPDQVQAQLAAHFAPSPLPEVTVEHLPEQDWIRAWMADFHAMRFGDRLWICPTNQEPPAPDQVNIRLDPGLAFGTGTHPTTALCLRWLDSYSLGGRDVIDFGCGSGVLAIGAALLGARQVRAVDIDAQAIAATIDNATRNQVAERVVAGLPDTLDPEQPAEVVLANILAATLVQLRAVITPLVRPEGMLILSGILSEQADSVMAAYESDFTFGPVAHEGEWVRLDGRRRG